ncbi:hypothetical protein J5N97_014565 [Dioscorea zingiberensis]|nr:hypothetical protein J5N97_014565 [Dioscorea zingiberensis]
MLRFLEDDRFPSTLKSVEITCCEMLMEWCEGVQGQSQLSQVPEVLVTDFGVDQIHELIKEEMGSEEEMDED